jgi:DNA uptake protein ComE-like DNA-binding protein
MIRQQRTGVLLLMGVILLMEIFIHRNFLFSGVVVQEELPSHLVKEITNYESGKKEEGKLTLFNPNDYSQEDWQKIGFSKKQAEVILKYKAMLGGKFLSKDQVKSCFVISEDKYHEISSFLQLPEKDARQHTISFSNSKHQLTPFDPNLYTVENWKNIGFSEKQAQVILKYKNRVGGKFISKEQIKECYVISGEKYLELEPFLRFSDKGVGQKPDRESGVIFTGKKELNSASFNDIISVIEDAGITKRILGFRKGLGGFVSKRQIKDVYDIPPEMIIQISEAFYLDVLKVRRINLMTATEEELHNHIYLRRYKSKIINARESGGDPVKVIPKSDPKYEFILEYLSK